MLLQRGLEHLAEEEPKVAGLSAELIERSGRSISLLCSLMEWAAVDDS